MERMLGRTMGSVGLALAAALAGGCESKTTATRMVQIVPAGGMGDLAEGPEAHLQKLYDSVDWKAVFADAVKDPALAASGWQGDAAGALEGQTVIRRMPATNFIEIKCTAADLPQAEAAAEAVADAFNERYGSGIRLPSP
jgi:hypothetical protein